MGKRLINVDEVEEIIPVLVGKLLENNLITEKQADQTIVSLWGGVVTSNNYQPNQLVKEEDIVVDKDLFLINTETGSLYFAGGGTYAQVPAIDGHEDFM